MTTHNPLILQLNFTPQQEILINMRYNLRGPVDYTDHGPMRLAIQEEYQLVLPESPVLVYRLTGLQQLPALRSLLQRNLR